MATSTNGITLVGKTTQQIAELVIGKQVKQADALTFVAERASRKLASAIERVRAAA